jgi:hypothetical protein
MASRMKGAWWARIAVVAAALALPLFAVGTAQAAMAGANPGVTTDRPDLMSATIVSSTEVQACFDKPVTLVESSFFQLGGYAAANTKSSLGTTTVDGANNHCVDAMYNPATIGDVDQYTFLTVESGAVNYGSVPNPANENRQDSTSLTGSDTHNGTTGLTIAPDLTGIASPTASEISSNSLVYEFDQAVASADPSDILMINDAGNYCKASGASVIANTNGRDVLATFPTTCFEVTQAIEGEASDDAVFAANDLATGNPMETQPTPFAPNGGVPIYDPYLVSATLDASNPDAIDYTFNQPVAVVDGSQFCYTGSLGHAQRVCAPPADVTNISKTVIQATFGGTLAKEQEYGVLAQVYGGDLGNEFRDSEPGACGANGCNLDQSTKLGDNAGAFARGFSTGPDVTAVSFNQSSDQATVNVDQRLCIATDCFIGVGPVLTSGIDLLPSFGNPTAAYNPISYSVTNPDQAAGPQQVVLQFAPVNSDGRTFGSQAMLQFSNCEALQATAQEVANSPCDAWNVGQIVQPVSSGAVLRAIRYNRAHAHGGGLVRRQHRIKHHRTHRSSRR